ncbi:hypothetical protein ACWCYY_34945 [Kitasatospora sp. NPDC001664]
MPYSPDAPDLFPPTVTICGTTRLWEAMAEAALHETAAGRMVLAPAVNMRTDHQLWADPADADALKTRLDALHLAKIGVADEVLVVTDAELYLGESTRREILHAEALETPVRYWVAGRGRVGESTLTDTSLRRRTAERWQEEFARLATASPNGPDRLDLLALAAADLALAEYLGATHDDLLRAARTHLRIDLPDTDGTRAALATRTTGTSTTDYLTRGEES